MDTNKHGFALELREASGVRAACLPLSNGPRFQTGLGHLNAWRLRQRQQAARTPDASRGSSSVVKIYSAQFLNGLPVLSMCLIRSMVLGSPHTLRKASRSRSIIYCSETKCREVKSPPQRIYAS